MNFERLVNFSIQDALAENSQREAVESSYTNTNPAFIEIRKSRSVLLLQGPVGPMFVKLANWLEKKGTRVHRVIFNGGDAWDSRSIPKKKLTYFDMPMKSWPSTFERLCFSQSVNTVVLFGQTRPCHEPIIGLAKKMGLKVVVVEEGYFRPGFATFELGGVNGYSDTLERFTWKSLTKNSQDLKPNVSKFEFFKTCWHATMYYVFLCLQHGRFSKYEHHRETSFLKYTKYWLNSWKVKLQRSRPDRDLFESIRETKKGFFFVPLQVEGDSQLTHHSRFKCLSVFIELVIHNFAKHAQSEDLLLFRQHPMSRGGVGNEKSIHALASKLGIRQRVFCVWEGDNPSILDACQGVVTVNSTVGLQALKRGKPVKVLGQALYDLPGVSAQQKLEEFWAKPQKPDPEVTSHFLQQLKQLTQVPCSIYANANEPWPFLKAE